MSTGMLMRARGFLLGSRDELMWNRLTNPSLTERDQGKGTIEPFQKYLMGSFTLPISGTIPHIFYEAGGQGQEGGHHEYDMWQKSRSE